jgi:hypothetical protein
VPWDVERSSSPGSTPVDEARELTLAVTDLAGNRTTLKRSVQLRSRKLL